MFRTCLGTDVAVTVRGTQLGAPRVYGVHSEGTHAGLGKPLTDLGKHAPHGELSNRATPTSPGLPTHHVPRPKPQKPRPGLMSKADGVGHYARRRRIPLVGAGCLAQDICCP
jgi:hypothetical protein